jgi:hypothetical protein
MNFKHKKYLIDNPSKLGKTGDYEPYLWYITNSITNRKFTFITRTSGTRVATKNLNNEETLINDAWNFVKFYLDQEKENEGLIIAINSNSELGSFYTPKLVVQCITDILVDIKNNEDQINQRWQSHKDISHYPMIIDPACGEGIFLKQSIVQGLTKKQWIFGLDLDPEAVDKWETTNLLQEFEGDRKALRSHFFHQNGLLPIQWSQHQKYYEGNINKKYLKSEQFDFVVGNPPYGGLGIYQEMKQLLDTIKPQKNISEVTVTKLDLFGGEKIEVTKPKKINNKETLSKEKIKELLSLSKELQKFSIWKDTKKTQKEKVSQIIPFNGLKINYADLLDEKEIERLKSFPIEVLFLERFIKLAKLPHKNKNGGVIAAIIPDGILSNSTMDYVRQFVGSQTKVLGIISLPRGTFKEAKTNAKTSILLLEKTDGFNILQNYPVFLASIPEIKNEYFVTIKQYFTQFMTQQKTTQYIDETNGLMIRTDKTLNDLNTEKPSSRWDPDFWNPKYEIIFDKHTSEPLDKFITNITYGVILTGENRKFKDSGVHYISSTTVTETGINHFLNPLFVNFDDKRNNENKRPEYGDIIMNRSGVGTLGRQCVFIDRSKKYTISDDTDLIKFKNISPFYVSVFLLTNYGKKQIDRRLRGVSGLIKLSFDDIKAIKIPILTDTIIRKIDERYIEMAKLHENAMEAKAEGKESEYKENLTKAQELLRDLVIKTEVVIKGERENVD